MIDIGLDLGTTTGYSVMEDGEVVDHGTWELGRVSKVKARQVASLHARLTNLVNEFGADAPYVRISYENVQFAASQAAAHLWGGWLAIVRLVFIQTGVTELVPCAVGTVKKFATGNGKAKKVDMIRAAEEKWGLTGLEHDTADALWVAEYGRQNHG